MSKLKATLIAITLLFVFVLAFTMSVWQGLKGNETMAQLDGIISGVLGFVLVKLIARGIKK